MKKNYISKIVSLIILAILIFSSIYYSYASQQSDLQDKKDDVQDQIDATNSEIAGVKSKMTDQLTQITRLNSQMNDYESEISKLESQLSDLNNEITEKQKNIEEKEKKYQENKELLEKRLVAMYKTGKTSYLDVLFSSKDISDFISKYYLIEKLTEHDTDLLDQISNEKEAIENEKVSLENSKKEVESSKQTIQTKKDALDVTKKEKQKVVNNLSAEEKALEEQLEEQEKYKKEIENEIAALIAEQKRKQQEQAKKNKSSSSSSNVSVNPSASGFICPIAGKTKHNITTGYYGYSGHTGVDFAVAGGTPVLAAKAGTVYKSQAKKVNGKYVSYGEHIIIAHDDGTITLYAHGMPNSRLVQAGDRVSQGQQIMSVGTTGNSTGYHLHFEVWVNGSRVNPTQYLP